AAGRAAACGAGAAAACGQRQDQPGGGRKSAVAQSANHSCSPAAEVLQIGAEPNSVPGAGERRDRTAIPAVTSGDMARYLQVSSDIAEQIAAGRLDCGDELPSIRQAARRYDTTATTIGRAWRHLTDDGVIEVWDRRRARVAAGGEVAARRLLGGHPALRLAGRDDPGLDIALRRAG